MFSSLRARLWLSYALLIVTALTVVLIVLVGFLVGHPLLYRQTYERLLAAQDLITVQGPTVQSVGPISQAFAVRVLVFSSNGNLIADSGNNFPALYLPTKSLIPRANLTVRDASGKVWLYSLKWLPDNSWLMIAAPRPKIAPALAILTDELLSPLLEGGLIALLLSLVLAFVIARWVADPLQAIVAAAKNIPTQTTKPVPESGPREIRDLTRSFNSMIVRVQSTQSSQRDFVANVSHELKTPLTSIQGFAQAMLDGTAETAERRKQAATVIFNEAGRMHRLALDLLDLARLDAGTADLKTTTVNLGELLNSIVERLSPLATMEGIKLSLTMIPDLPIIIGDGDRLAQVFTNLIDNGLKFTPSGGKIDINAMESDGRVQVSVSDTGVGISSEALPHIFDRFYRADTARAGGDQHGAGLGLAIAQEIVAAHGGRISVRSAEGQGTTFVVYLPLGPST